MSGVPRETILVPLLLNTYICVYFYDIDDLVEVELMIILPILVYEIPYLFKCSLKEVLVKFLNGLQKTF